MMTGAAVPLQGPEQFESQRELLESLMDQWFLQLKETSGSAELSPGLQTLWDSMNYSLCHSGKRTRPILGLLIAEQLGVDPRRLLPWVMSVEMIHTYSLIHDDLPCMDDDDLRRGRATNHKVFGEATALLAGDTLLTEAFGLVARSYSRDPEQAVKAISLLSEGAGFHGMAGGQAIDLLSKDKKLTEIETKTLHEMKTGALFRTVSEGVAILSGTEKSVSDNFRKFGASLGFAFQLADDILDSSEVIEVGSFPALIGLSETKELLKKETKLALNALNEIGISSGPLVSIALWNQERKV
jgi:geranylgeranyl diphosphate synthase type II